MAAEEAGTIRDLRRQVPYKLVLPNGVPVKTRSEGVPNGRQCSYTADSTYTLADGSPVVEEFKGMDDPTSKLRRAITEAIFGIKINVVKKLKAPPGSSIY